jgi:peptidoglycan/xylan/chitin deacetylase (PgdA/CDA1 family)
MINSRSIAALYAILNILKKHNVKALFFITGHFAEKLRSFSGILDMLQAHEIGYHSTCHSVRPNIFEYTDLINYQDAYEISLKRETAHINAMSGEVEGRGGIEVLRDLFPGKKIETFRAPGFSWSPPHLEALASVGFKYDFSTNLSLIPVHYKGITFYPMPTLIDWKATPNYYKDLLSSVLTERITVLDFHPNRFVNQNHWDLFFPNPAPQLSVTQTKLLLLRFEALLTVITLLQKSKLTETSPKLKESKTELGISEVDVEKVLKQIALWPLSQFNYKPRYLRSHLSAFFNCNKHLQQ